MFPSNSQAVIFGLAIFTSTTNAAISLSSFKSDVGNLNAACTTVYNMPIDGCVEADFDAGATCRSSCVSGLNKIQTAVVSACAGVDTSETSIIGFFQNGLGVQALCPKTASASPAPDAQVPAATGSTRSNAPAAPSSSSSSTQPSPTPKGAIAADPSATSTLITSTLGTLRPSAPSSKSGQNPKHTNPASSQLSNSASGGGSPFDVQATGPSSQLRAIDAGVASILAGALLFLACA